MKSLLLCIPLALAIGCSHGAATTAAADNTKNNARDRSGRTVTPTDQPEDPADRSLAQSVRQAVTGDSSYSTDAKNIKIIAQKGRVTLRGVVDNADERDSIASKVKSLPGVVECDNQLEVKNK